MVSILIYPNRPDLFGAYSQGKHHMTEKQIIDKLNRLYAERLTCCAGEKRASRARVIALIGKLRRARRAAKFDHSTRHLVSQN